MNRHTLEDLMTELHELQLEVRAMQRQVADLDRRFFGCNHTPQEIKTA